MKKLILATVMLGTSLVIPATAAEAKDASFGAGEPQIRVRVGQPRRRSVNRRPSVRTITRIVRVGRYRYREVVRVTTHPNGRVTYKVVSRTRIGRR